jgi:hypothetical protein
MAVLRHFKADEVVVDQEQAFRLLKFFWIEPGIIPGSLTVDDRAFAQALLLEAIDRSYEMGYVELIFKNFFMKVPTNFKDIEDIVKSFAKAAAKHWFRHATGKDLEDPKIYENVRVTIANNFYQPWKIRVSTSELTY